MFRNRLGCHLAGMDFEFLGLKTLSMRNVFMSLTFRFHI